jgi:hypothetical protein
MKNLLSLLSRPNPIVDFTSASVQTTYIRMLLELQRIPTTHNLLAGFFTWILLASYAVLPGTFTSLIDTTSLHLAPAFGTESAAKIVQNPPLLWIAGLCCIVGASGMVCLWRVRRTNYIWLVDRLFL